MTQGRFSCHLISPHKKTALSTGRALSLICFYLRGDRRTDPRVISTSSPLLHADVEVNEEESEGDPHYRLDFLCAALKNLEDYIGENAEHDTVSDG